MWPHILITRGIGGAADDPTYDFLLVMEVMRQRQLAFLFSRLI